MEELFDGDLIAYSAEDLMFLATESKRLDAGNGLELYLNREGFKQIEPQLYSHESPTQLIQLIPDNQGISYKNLLNEQDHGHYIQFLQNRFLAHGKVVPNRQMFTFLSAVRYALDLEKVKSKKIIPKHKIKRKRRGKGL